MSIVEFTDIERVECSRQEYFDLPFVSNSDLGILLDNPSLYRKKMNGEWKKKETQPMRFGSAFDCFLLDGKEVFEEEWRVVKLKGPSTDMQVALVSALRDGLPNDIANAQAGYKKVQDGSQWREYIDQTSGSEWVTSEEMHLVRDLEQAIMEHISAPKYIEKSEKQVIHTGVHAATGIKVKGMADMVYTNENGDIVVMDLKTSSARSVYQFKNSFWKYRYDQQIAMYTALHRTHIGAFMVVGKDPVQAFPLLEVSQDDWMEGNDKLETALFQLKWHLDEDLWDFPAPYYINDGWSVL